MISHASLQPESTFAPYLLPARSWVRSQSRGNRPGGEIHMLWTLLLGSDPELAADAALEFAALAEAHEPENISLLRWFYQQAIDAAGHDDMPKDRAVIVLGLAQLGLAQLDLELAS